MKRFNSSSIAKGLGLLLALLPLALILGTHTAQADPLTPQYEHTIALPDAAQACVSVAGEEQCAEIKESKVTFTIAASAPLKIEKEDSVASGDCTLMAETIILTLEPGAETESQVMVTMDGTTPPIEETITATPGDPIPATICIS